MISPWQKSDPKWLALAVETNPWTPPDDLRTALLFRGAIVSAWAALDTTLAELALRASNSEAYNFIEAKYPYKPATKVKYLKRVLASPGPLQKYAKLGNLLLDRYENAVDLRNQMAHAHMRVLGRWGATFTDYNLVADGVVTKRTHRYTLEQLEIFARKATRLSRLTQRGKSLIDEHRLLPDSD